MSTYYLDGKCLDYPKHILQASKEILPFLEKVKELKPKIILEIGSGRGGTALLFSHVIVPEGKVISLDVRDIDVGENKGQDFSKVLFCKGDSHLESTKCFIGELLKGEKIDVLFIDGDHTYKGVKKDHAMYKGFVRNGGIIGFHDIALCREDNGLDDAGGNVMQFWWELKVKVRKFGEFIKDTAQGGGIGYYYR